MGRYVIPETLSGKEIKTIRHALNMTQKEFAIFTCSSVPTVERWESGKKEVSGPIVTLLEILRRDTEIPKRLELPLDRLKLRLYYMCKNMVCTVIDVDEVTRKILIKNYTDNLLYRAFGKNTEPSFDDYEEFIRSRCFPESRDKLKLELKRLDIPFYDPIMIIEKTGGRMADDDFWIRIER